MSEKKLILEHQILRQKHLMSFWHCERILRMVCHWAHFEVMEQGKMLGTVIYIQWNSIDLKDKPVLSL